MDMDIGSSVSDNIWIGIKKYIYGMYIYSLNDMFI